MHSLFQFHQNDADLKDTIRPMSTTPLQTSTAVRQKFFQNFFANGFLKFSRFLPKLASNMHWVTCQGPRDLRVVQVSALYDAWRSKKLRKTKNFKNCKHATFFAIFEEILPSYAKTDVSSRFIAFVCLRLTYFQLYTTQTHH